MKNLILVVAVVAVAGLIVVGWRTSRAGYESASYRVLQQAGTFELREYPSLVVAETVMAGGDNGSFRRLFGYITGNNATAQKIAMTTPVFMSGTDTNTRMAFVLPAKMALEGVPRPGDRAVSVRQLAGGSFAVYRYRGGRSRARETPAVTRLQDWMQSQRLPAESEPVFAYYDPPWTPPFLRRNEVLIRTKSSVANP